MVVCLGIIPWELKVKCLAAQITAIQARQQQWQDGHVAMGWRLSRESQIVYMPSSAPIPRGRVQLPNLWMVLVCLLTALPCVVSRYLPMTDLPQHEAIVSIIRHFHDPAYGFDRYYDWALDRMLYVFPYALAVGLAFIALTLPIKGRVDPGMPDTPKKLQWASSRFSECRLGHFYDTILVRNKSNGVRRQAYVGQALTLEAGQWQVFRPVSRDLAAPK